ncbi:hypothetical protein HN924_02120 [Candidatus Woesearchaeota archaeon]|jgi:hypothetical protein|nr:hypothetical protein [Candidatus Woesearchaeota archaeon]MBT7062740.1 hypothetical protein [Candidatus Woesearchaeota archaeon]MBT7402985.1 hypothetical protein [Candidatus Woesearchaeota archaeon]
MSLNNNYILIGIILFVIIIILFFVQSSMQFDRLEGDFSAAQQTSEGQIQVIEKYTLTNGQSQDLAFGGEYVWHADSGQTARNVIIKMNSGDEIAIYTNPETVKHIGGLAYSNDYIWGVDCQLPYGTDYQGSIYKIAIDKLEEGLSWDIAIKSNFSASYPYTNQNAGLTCEDDECRFLWLANWGEPSSIYRIDTEKAIADGFISQDSITRTLLPKGIHTNFQGLAWANEHIWVTDSTPGNQAILKIDQFEGFIVQEYSLNEFILEEDCPKNACEGEGLAFDGEHFWFSTTRPQKLYKLVV